MPGCSSGSAARSFEHGLPTPAHPSAAVRWLAVIAGGRAGRPRRSRSACRGSMRSTCRCPGWRRSRLAKPGSRHPMGRPRSPPRSHCLPGCSAWLRRRRRRPSRLRARRPCSASGLALALSGHAATAAPRLLTVPARVPARRLRRLLDRRAVAARRSRCVEAMTGGRALARFSRVIPYPLGSDRRHRRRAGGRSARPARCAVDHELRPRARRQARRGAGAARARRRSTATCWCRASKPSAPRPRGRSRSRSPCELVLALAILALVALWRFTPPPRALAAAAPISRASARRAGHGADRAHAGADGQGARVSMQVLDGEFRPLAAKEVALVLANAAAGIEPLRRAAVHAGDSNWRIDDFAFRSPGSGACGSKSWSPISTR